MQRDPEDIKKDFTEEELSNKSFHPKAQYTNSITRYLIGGLLNGK